MALVGDVYKDFVGVDVNGVSIGNKQNEFLICLWIAKDVQSQDVIQYFLDLAPQITLVADPAYQSCLMLLKQNS